MQVGTFQVRDFLGKHPELPRHDQGESLLLLHIRPAHLADGGVHHRGPFQGITEEIKQPGIAKIIVEGVLRRHELLHLAITGIGRRGQRKLGMIRRVQKRADQIEMALDAVVDDVGIATGAVKKELPATIIQCLSLLLGGEAGVENPSEILGFQRFVFGDDHRGGL